MMQRKDPYNNAIAKDRHQDWYFTGVVDTSVALDTPPTSARGSERRQTPLKVKRSEETMSALKRRLPHYLTRTGSVLSASLEVNDEIVCCVPGGKSRPKSGSTFLTDAACQESAKEEPEPISENSSLRKVDSCWQPLTADALLEHSKVSEIPIRGVGHLAHGQYSMWKPKNMQDQQ